MLEEDLVGGGCWEGDGGEAGAGARNSQKMLRDADASEPVTRGGEPVQREGPRGSNSSTSALSDSRV